MPYSALHAMMCCHTNESDPPSPSFRFFLTLKEFVFLFSSLLSKLPSRFDFFRSLSDDESIDLEIANKKKKIKKNERTNELTNERRDGLERETVRGTIIIDKLTNEREEAPAKKKKPKRKERLFYVTHVRCCSLCNRFFFSFFVLPLFSRFDPRAGTSSFVMYKTEM